MKKVYKNKSLIILSVLLITVLVTPVIDAEDSTNIYERNIFADIAEDVDNGVVKVTSHVEVQGSSYSPFYNDPFFEYFFGESFPAPDEEPKIQKGFGTGFVVSENGYIVTNQHVIDEAKKVEVTIKGYEEPIEAEVAWSDFSLDLAVLKVDVDKDLQPLKMGNSDNIRPGDWAVAIGNPFGFEHTVTVGVISALERPIQVPTDNNQIRTYRNLIQLDAAINPGNSGGPLLNINGEVTGINTAVSRQGQGIGFAIPVNEIKDIVQELKVTGEVKRPWLGIYFQAINQDIKEYFDLDSTQGVIVVDVVKDSPAVEAGLQPYDIIKEIDEEKIKNTDQVVEIIKKKDIGEKIMLKIIRNGQSMMIFGHVGKKPNEM